MGDDRGWLKARTINGGDICLCSFGADEVFDFLEKVGDHCPADHRFAVSRILRRRLRAGCIDFGDRPNLRYLIEERLGKLDNQCNRDLAPEDRVWMGAAIDSADHSERILRARVIQCRVLTVITYLAICAAPIAIIWLLAMLDKWLFR